MSNIKEINKFARRNIMRIFLSLLAAFFLNQTSVFAYDFHSTSPSGHVLYYRIINDSEVFVTWQYSSGMSYDSLSGSVTIPPSVLHSGKTYSVTGIDDNAFKSCWYLTSITIPNTVVSVGLQSFYFCSSLYTIHWGSSVQTIGASAFENCSSLTNIDIPNSVVSIGNHAFEYCTAVSSISIGNSVTTIGERAFSNCSSATTLTLGNSVSTIGDGAFSYCTGLISLTIGDSVVTIGEMAFNNCSSVTSLIIGNSVETIGNDAFDGCSGITSVNIPSSVGYIGASAFYDCTNLTYTSYSGSISQWLNITFGGTFSSPVIYSRCLYINDTVVKSVVIPEGVTKININTFCGMDSLCSVQFPSSLLAIDHYAFYECRGLSKIEIPSSVNSIGRCAFYGCGSLDTIICKRTTPPSCISNSSYHPAESFVGAPLTAKVFVPCQSVEEYQSSDGWNYFSNYIPQYEPVIYSISSSNPTMGSVNYSVLDECGHSIMVSATPNEGYFFLYWSDGSTNNPYHYYSNNNEIVLVAVFSASSGITVTLTPNDITMGGVTGSGVYQNGDTVVCTAIPFSGYEFRGWSNGSQDNPYVFIARENTELMAIFVKQIGVEENTSEQINVFPNPSSSIITIDNIRIDTHDILYVFDKLGREIKKIPCTPSDKRITLDVSDLESGIYLIKIGQSTHRIIVN